MIIYKATNKKNNKSYIGQTINSLDDRKYGHILSSKQNSDLVFHQAIRKYGEDNFDWEILEECSSIEELNEREMFYIKELDTYGKGYNMNEGGWNATHDKKTIEKMSKSRKEWHSKNDTTGENNPFYGKTHSEETKQHYRDLYCKTYTLIIPNEEPMEFKGKYKVKEFVDEFNRKNKTKVSFHSMFVYGRNAHGWIIKKHLTYK